MSHRFVISTEGRNHTRNSVKNVDNLCRATSVISPFGRDDKIKKTSYENEVLAQIEVEILLFFLLKNKRLERIAGKCF